MSCWELLGIEATSDRKTIKRAYAKKLKQLDIEKEPATFQQLKEALDTALVLSADQADSQQTAVEDNLLTREKIEDEQSEETLFTDFTEPERATQALDDLGTETVEPTPTFFSELKEKIEPKPTFTRQLNEFLEKETFYNDLTGWEALLSSMNDWDITEYLENRTVIQQFLRNHYPLISNTVSDYLLKNLQLDGDAHDFRQEGQWLATYQEIKKMPSFSFDFYEQLEPDKRTLYFQSRYTLYKLLATENSDSPEWQSALEQCKNLIDFDSDVLLMETCYVLRNDFRMSKLATKQFIIDNLAMIPTEKITDGWLFIQQYLDIQQFKIAFFDSYTVYSIPESVFHLLVGYLAYRQNDIQRAQFHWYPFLEEYGDQLFLSTELNHFFNAQPKKAPHYKIPAEKTYSRKRALVTYFMEAVLLFFVIMKIFNPTTTTTEPEHEPSTTVPTTINLDLSIGFKYTDDVTQKFFYFVYLKPDDTEKSIFVSTDLTTEAQQQLVSFSSSTAPFSKSDLYFIKTYSVQTKEHGKCSVVKMDNSDSPIFILKINSANQIETIYGDDWHKENSDDDDYKNLWEEIKSLDTSS